MDSCQKPFPSSDWRYKFIGSGEEWKATFPPLRSGNDRWSMIDLLNVYLRHQPCPQLYLWEVIHRQRNCCAKNILPNAINCGRCEKIPPPAQGLAFAIDFDIENATVRAVIKVIDCPWTVCYPNINGTGRRRSALE